jgi:hypothetical protein
MMDAPPNPQRQRNRLSRVGLQQNVEFRAMGSRLMTFERSAAIIAKARAVNPTDDGPNA